MNLRFSWRFDGPLFRTAPGDLQHGRRGVKRTNGADVRREQPREPPRARAELDDVAAREWPHGSDRGQDMSFVILAGDPSLVLRGLALVDGSAIGHGWVAFRAGQGRAGGHPRRVWISSTAKKVRGPVDFEMRENGTSETPWRSARNLRLWHSKNPGSIKIWPSEVEFRDLHG